MRPGPATCVGDASLQVPLPLREANNMDFLSTKLIHYQYVF